MKTTLLALASITLSTTITNFTNFTNHAKQNNITQLYVLGDSLSDSNNLSSILDSYTGEWHKINFKSPFFDNSFTDGDTATKVLAKNLGLSLTPAWNNKTTGNNYAVAGALAGQGDSFEDKWFLNKYSINKQADKLIQDHQIQQNDQIFLEIGGNDLLNDMNVSDPNTQQLNIEKAINSEMTTIQNLINHGAQHLIISNAPDISDVPMFNQSTQKALAHKLSSDFDNLWHTQINDLIKNNEKINILPFDLNNTVTNLISKAQKLGMNTTNQSISYSIWDLLINKAPQYVNGTTPQTINNNFFFDNIHPNKWGHQQIGNLLYQLIKKSF